MKKKTLILISIIILTLFLENNVFAENTIYTDGPFNYIIENNNITIIYYFGEEETVKVPMAIGEHFVTTIGDGAFIDSDVKEVELPDTITSISSTAFNNIESMDFKYFDVNDAYVEMTSPIIYQDMETVDESNKNNQNSNNNNEKKETTSQNISEDVQFENNNIEVELDAFNEDENEDIDSNNQNSNSTNNIISEDQTIKNTSTIVISPVGYVLIIGFVISIIFIITKKIRKK